MLNKNKEKLYMFGFTIEELETIHSTLDLARDHGCYAEEQEEKLGKAVGRFSRSLDRIFGRYA